MFDLSVAGSAGRTAGSTALDMVRAIPLRGNSVFVPRPTVDALVNAASDAYSQDHHTDYYSNGGDCVLPFGFCSH